jgi:glycosyltransferase involved in cell wall biosynthesis
MHIHVVSNSLWVNSGFGKVARYLALGLKKLGHTVSSTGIQTALRVDHEFGIDCYPIDTGGHVDEAGQLYLNIQNLKPDVLLYVGQTDADMNYVTKIFDKQVIYCPVEGQNIPDGMASDLKSVINRGGVVIAQCDYGYNEMKKAGVDVSKYIYHGIDHNVFYPIKDIDKHLNSEKVDKNEIVSVLKLVRDYDGKAKWQQYDINLLEFANGMKGKFIYGFMGNNFGMRKQIPRLLKAYSILIGENRQIKDRSVLVLHTLPMSIRGVNLIKTVHQLGIQDNVVFAYSAFGSNGWSESGMNIWYNLCDVNVSATSSEGFSLPVIEGFATGLPMIAPDCSSQTELIGNDADWSKNRGLLADIVTYHQIQDGSERALVSEFDLALKMKMAYVEKDKMKVFSDNAIKFAGGYTWDKICVEFDKVLVGLK